MSLVACVVGAAAVVYLVNEVVVIRPIRKIRRDMANMRDVLSKVAK